MVKIQSTLYAGKPTGTITFDLTEMSIEILLNHDESIDIPAIYTSLKTAWRYQEPLMKYDFPVLCKTVQSLIIRKPWILMIHAK